MIPQDQRDDSSDGGSSSVGRRATWGALWMSIAQILSRGLGTIRIVILADLLTRGELGRFGIALIVMQLADRFAETGMRQALIQRKGSIDALIDTAWVTQITRGFAIGVLLVLAAEPVEAFFEKDNIASLIRLLAILPVLQGFYNLGLVHLHRELRFQRIAIHQIAISATDLLVSVALSFKWPIAEALVAGKISGVVVGLATSFILDRRYASFRFSGSDFAKLYKFGFWIFVSTVLSFTLIRGGDLVTGKLLPLEDLAVYQIAYGLACVPIMEVMGVVGRASFPAFSRLQDDPDRLAAAFLKVLSVCSVIATFVVTGAFALSTDFVAIFFDAEYAPVAPLLPLLAIWGACRALGAANSTLLNAVGKPALATAAQFLMVVLFAVFLIPMAIKFGLWGIAISLVAIGLTAQLVRYFFILSVLPTTIPSIMLRVLFPIGIGAIAFVPTYLLMQWIGPQFNWFRLILGTLTLTIVYGIGTILIDRQMQFGVLSFIAGYLPERSKNLLGLSKLQGATK